VVEQNTAREVLYDARYFNMPKDSIAHDLPAGAGFAGFRVQEPTDGTLDWRKNDWVAFLGASYFRAIGELRQYGLSVRGVALNTWQAGEAEEFPDFTQIFIGPETAEGLVVHALLEGPSIVGAYRFVLSRGKGRGLRAVSAQQGVALRRGAADLHVLVLRNRQSHRRRLAARSARFRRLKPLDR